MDVRRFVRFLLALRPGMGELKIWKGLSECGWKPKMVILFSDASKILF